MFKTLINNLARILGSDSTYISMTRGLFLYGATAIILLSAVGILFSESTLGFIKYLPLAAILIAVILFFQLSLWPINSKKIINFIFFTIISIYLIGGVLNAYIGAKIYDGAQYDGAFQLYFPLKRISEGEWPGKDFFYFHGQLIPVLIYPLFKFFGGDFFASQISSKLVDLIIPLAYFVIFRWLGLDRIRSLVACILLIGLLVSNRFTFGTQNPIDGVHIYALRSLVPFLYIAYLSRQLTNRIYLDSFTRFFYRRTVFIQASIFVLSFYLGSEQAIYLLGAMILSNLIAVGFRPVQNLTITLLLIVASISLLLLSNEILFGSQKPLTYLGEISKNQTWFYAGYPNEFLHSILDFSRFRSSTFKVSAKIIVCLLGVPALAWMAWFLLPRSDKRIFIFSLIGGSYGLIGLSSFLASYSGEQYADNAVKMILIVGILLFIKISSKEITPIATRRKINQIPKDLISAAPALLVTAVLGCIYSTVAALNINSNFHLRGLLSSELFMGQPDLGVKLPFNSIRFQANERDHASQFLALDYAQGNKSSRILYPEYTFANGFNEGVKQLYSVTLNQDIPESIAIGDFCKINGAELSIGDLDVVSRKIYFNISESFIYPELKSAQGFICYRKATENYTIYDGATLHIDHNIYDKNFIDGLFRAQGLQLKIRLPELPRLRVGDALYLREKKHVIKAVYGNGVITLDTAIHPLPFDFDNGATYKITQKIAPYNNFKERINISSEGKILTRIIFNDRNLLSEISKHKRIYIANTNESARILSVNIKNTSIDIEGYFSQADTQYGLHLGELKKSNFRTVGQIVPVFQLMKGILSVKTFGQQNTGSSIDFVFHTFNPSLLAQYMEGIKSLDPKIITVPSGRYVNNFSWYDNWLLRGRWPVYEYLLLSYDPVAHSKFESFWRKGEHYDNNGAWNTIDITVNENGQNFNIPTNNSIVSDSCNITAFEVELDYSITGWQRKVPLIGGSARHMALIDDLVTVPLTFNPNENSVKFPVFSSKDDARVRIKTISPFGFGSSINVSAARYRQLNLPANRIAEIVGRSKSGICP